ncbi:hypothetical protein NSZ01_36580 [Nocardioides szechwanensis]|uniref:Uncharacterized protein n=1 Tax=Nocardioides szechwanensis TaxID=1005944 RepID=A0A1G9ZQ97_9ACTN|nr:hypothetical protein [Nocardioides szechwanensis]GEP35890.1 hypothetical protein NSZ01_36580 [Nocardioides szechwanensis]SDN23478.1 hypothetical protein SAMN05192576_1809 [Nocardioides szechwanensis]
MNDVRTLFEGLVADPPPDPLDLDQVVARGTHRRRVRRAVTAGAGLAAALVVGSGIAVVAMPDDTKTAPAVVPTGLPDQVEVVCTPEGVTLSATTITAQDNGVVLVVSSTMPPGTSLSYFSDGGFSGEALGGGQRLPAEPQTWTLPLAPGMITLACDPPGIADPDEEVTMTVTDPEGYWRGETITDPPCSPGLGPSWVIGISRGTTPDEAVEGVLDGFRELNDDLPVDEASAFLARRASPIGYVGSGTETRVMFKDNRPFATIVVTGSGSEFVARPDAMCGR